MTALDPTKFHALLVGIDDYEGQPLSGCVNDIDCVQAFLIDKLGVTPERIRRLEAGLELADSSPIPEDRLPTYDNLAAALRFLASDAVQPGDRVFIYYSGHGSYEMIPQAEAYFEGLVPLDHAEAGLLYDVELNAMLQSIAQRSGDLTVILDCCHSAGATRHVAAAAAASHWRARFLEPEKTPRSASRVAGAAARLAKLGRSAGALQAPLQYTVAAACHADEVAQECRFPPRVGRSRGLFTYSLFELLEKLEGESLAALRWSDIWEQLKSMVHELQPNQRPMLLGPRERRLFGGPWQPQDVGYAVTRGRDGGYTIAAGSLAGLGLGAELAIYGPEPALFPPLDSPADQQARLGVVAVHEVQPAQSTARLVPPESPPLKLPAGARGRLIRHGKPDLLRVAVGPELDPEVKRLLDEAYGSARLTLLPADDPRVECRVGQYANGDIWIGDDLFGPGPPLDPTAPGPMGRIRVADAASAAERSLGLRAALNHYSQYVIPLRVYRSGGFTLSEQAVEVKLLDCAASEDPLQLERSASLRHQARWDGTRRRYLLDNLAPVAIQVRNTLNLNLYVFLLLCSLEGQIQLLADNEVLVKSRSSKIFWSDNVIGQPFLFQSPAGYDWGVDRLIVIATDQKGVDLEALKQEHTMNEVIAAVLVSKGVLGKSKAPAVLRWTAVQVLIQVGGPGTDRAT